MFGAKKVVQCGRNLPLAEAIKRARILVIDDVNDEFPFEILRRHGYAIDHWTDVVDLSKLEQGFYDIIILDIGGVAHAYDPQKEGIAVLTHIKNVNPSQIVVAHSGQSHETSRIPFFRLADQYVPKPTDAMTWKEILDDLVQNKVTVEHLWSSLRAVLENKGFSAKQIDNLEKEIVVAAKKKQNKADPGQIIDKTLGTIDKVSTIAAIIGKIVALCA